MLSLKKITVENHDLAFETFHKVFGWLEKDKDPYAFLLDKDSDFAAEIERMAAEYYLVYDGETLVGITGFYRYPFAPESAWLGWFGVLPEQRRNHYGSKILKLHEEALKEKGYKFSRLYTDTQNNAAARAFYERNGYVGEDYYCPEDKFVPKGMITVYGKSLCGEPLPPWNNQNMNVSLGEKLPEGMTLEEYYEAMINAPHQ